MAKVLAKKDWASRSEGPVHPHAASRSEGDRLSPSSIPILQTASSLQTLQRLVGNRAVVGAIGDGRMQPSSGLAVQREGEPDGAIVRGGSNRLYVGNLSFNTSQESIEAIFAAAGEVREVSMPTDRETGQPRGFAFVTMGNGGAASRAISQLNGAMLDGRPLRVNEAQGRTGSAGAGGGRGGGFGGGGGGGRSEGGRGGRDRY